MTNLAWEEAAPPRILIVDDNPTVHEAFDKILQHHGSNQQLEQGEALMFGSSSEPRVTKPAYQIDHALSGAEGVEKVEKSLELGGPYQVAFVDIRMPGMDGVETIERMWKLDGKVQMVICTAYADYRWEDLAKRLGRTDRLLVLKKPFHNIEVMQLASTLSMKWQLALRAEMKLEQAITLVSRRTQKLLEMQRRENLPGQEAGRAAQAGGIAETHATGAGTSEGSELPFILMIGEDGELLSQIAAAISNGYSVCDATTPAQGLNAAKENVPDLIVVDGCGLGDAGVKLCGGLKSDHITSHIPVILLAADHTDETQVRALEAGASEFLVKPLRLPVLKARVGNLLEERRKLHEYFRQLQTVQPREIAGSQMDAEFLRRVVDIVEKNMADYEFDVEKLARQVAMSRRQLFRKFKAVAGCTPNVFVRDIRLKRAAQLLRESRMTVSEIIYAVGFSDPKYFRNIFRERFGVLPGEYGDSAG
jgi:CheY-like chemotaxis protein/AraC-like DNA-binding protein